RDYLVREMLNEATDRETTNAPMHDYDFIVFDCPPQAAHNPLIRPTLLACDIIVTPVRMDAFSIKGLSQMFNELNMMVKCFKHRPKILLVPTFYDERLRRCRDAMEYLHSNFEEYLSGARIPTTEELPSNLSRPAPLALANPTAKVIQQNFTPLIKELIDVSYGLANSTSKAVTSNG
ncbi:MAG: ParA family protein, partial [Deefgea sp.]